MINSVIPEFSTSFWNNSFTGFLEVTNRGHLVDSWQVVFESEFTIAQLGNTYQIMGASVVSEEEIAEGRYRYIVEPFSYNQVLNPQESVLITFHAPWLEETIPEVSNVIIKEPKAESKPKDFLGENSPNLKVSITPENNLDAEFDFILVNDWGTGFEGQISITNNTGGNIDTWSLEFDFPHQINNIWDAEIETNDDGSYVITHTPWNREIAIGETLTFGFQGNNSFTSEPEKFKLTGSIFNSLSISENIYTSSNPDLSPELTFQNYQGRATFYDLLAFNEGKGNSGYDLPAPNEREKVTAINSVQWNGSEASGAFFEVSGPKQRDGAAPIIVQVIDQLPERADGFDLSLEAFPKIAEPSDGVVNINYKLVGPPDDYLTAYGYRIDQGIVVEGISATHPYYAAVRLNNHRYPIESIDLITDGGNLIALERKSDNKFVLSGNYPLYGAQDLLVTDIFGQQLTLDDVNITNGSSADIITGQQFDLL